jgi:hypothetical protein
MVPDLISLRVRANQPGVRSGTIFWKWGLTPFLNAPLTQNPHPAPLLQITRKVMALSTACVRSRASSFARMSDM